MDAHNQLRLLGRSHCACTVSVKCTDDEKNRPFLRCSIRPNLVLIRPWIGLFQDDNRACT